LIPRFTLFLEPVVAIHGERDNPTFKNSWQCPALPRAPPPSLSLAKPPDGDGEIIIEIDGRLAFDAFHLRLQPERMASACSTMNS
jgi:hypothetical protein